MIDTINKFNNLYITENIYIFIYLTFYSAISLSLGGML